MNRFGTQAMAWWQTNRPSQLAMMDDPNSFFLTLGHLIEARIIEISDETAGPDLPEETYLGKVGRLNAAIAAATEQAMNELVYSQPVEDQQPDRTRPVTPRHLRDIDDPTVATLLAVIDAARAAATPHRPAAMATIMCEAERRAPTPNTGHKLARLTGLAGSTSAHQLRLTENTEPWHTALHNAAAAFCSWDFDQRMQTALNLRTTFKDLTNPPPQARATRLIAAWLTHTSGQGLITATAQLAHHTLTSQPTWNPTTWWAVNGTAAIDHITTTQGRLSQGRPTPAEATHRALLRTAVLAVHATGLIPPTKLAARAGITRATLSAWTRPPLPPPDHEDLP